MFQRGIDDAPLLAMLLINGILKKDYTFIPHNFDNMSLIKVNSQVMSAYLTNQPNVYRSMGMRLFYSIRSIMASTFMVT
jgi:hypothetical protein